MKLNLGCGPRKLKGYVNVDLNSKYADIVSDVRSLPAFDSESAEEIIASHIIEHFYLWEVQDILKEWFRVLKPGGHIYIECPNIRRCMSMFIEQGYDERYTMWGLYGNPHTKEPLMCHKWGYTPESLAFELQKAGFVDIGQSSLVKVGGRDMRLVATKPEVK